MDFLLSIDNGLRLIRDSFKLLFKKPIFLLPIILSWLIISLSIIYFSYYSNYDFSILTFFIFLFFIVLILTISNLIVLEFIEQLETIGKISFLKAIKDTFGIDLIKALPIVFFWTIIWFIIILLRTLSKNKRNKKNKENFELSAENFAKTLGKSNNPFSWLGMGLNMFEKLIRMIVFMSLPGIAWENKGPFKSLKNGIEIIKKHPGEFLTSYSATLVISVIMAIPLIIIFTFSDNGVQFSTAFWVGVIIYECVIWTLGMYFEQISVALLYMWHLNWKKSGGNGNLSEIPKPNLLDNHFDLNFDFHNKVMQKQGNIDKVWIDYINQYKNQYSKNSIKNVMVSQGVSKKKAEEYLNKYY